MSTVKINGRDIDHLGPRSRNRLFNIGKKTLQNPHTLSVSFLSFMRYLLMTDLKDINIRDQVLFILDADFDLQT